MASLNQFGAVMTFAIELESRLEAYYAGIGNGERSDAAAKRKSKMERVRRENVVEITLEPIDGLDENDYLLNLDDSSAEGQNAVEQTAARFYADVAPKINVRQAQRAMERCGKEHASLISK